MNIEVLKSKIHRTTLSQANLNNTGSISVDEGLLEAANSVEFDLKKLKHTNPSSYFPPLRIN